MATQKISPLIAIKRYMDADEKSLGVKHLCTAEELKCQTRELTDLKACTSEEEMKALGKQAVERLNELAKAKGEDTVYELKE